jgi:hypothetical protein
VPIPRPLEQRLLTFAVLGEEIGDRLERDFTAEESLDVSMDVLHAHFSVGLGLEADETVFIGGPARLEEQVKGRT